MRHWCHLVVTNSNAGHCVEREEKQGQGCRRKGGRRRKERGGEEGVR